MISNILIDCCDAGRLHIYYDEIRKSFWIDNSLFDGVGGYGRDIEIVYCPWCGEKLRIDWSE